MLSVPDSRAFSTVTDASDKRPQNETPLMTPNSHDPAEQFLTFLRQWNARSDPDIDIVDLSKADGKPLVIIRTQADGTLKKPLDDYTEEELREEVIGGPGAEEAASEAMTIAGACAGAFAQCDYEVNRAYVVMVPREARPKALSFIVEAGWVRKYREGDWSIDDVIEQIDETRTIIDNPLVGE